MSDDALPVEERLTGVVVCQQANFFYVMVGADEYACSLRGRLKKEGETPYVGDRVEIVLEPPAPGERLPPPRSGSLMLPDRPDAVPDVRSGAISTLLPRRNLLERPTIANVDQVLLVVAAAQPEFSAYMLDKFLVLAAHGDLPPVIVINKRDLVPPEQLAAMIDGYRSIGYAVVSTAAGNADVSELLPHLAGKLSVLAGPSGVGKSSIVNAMLPGLELRALEVSTKLQRGRHTTRHAALYALVAVPDALIADTPGFSFLEMEAILPKDLGWYFPEMAPHIADCKLPSCLHMQEHSCAVKERAVIRPERYESYVRLLDEVQAIERDAAERSSKEETAVKRRMGAGGLEGRLVKVDVAARESDRKTRNQRLNADWQEAAEDEDDFELDDLEALDGIDEEA
ncbi:MAG: rsgA [Cyanobacteria bacterium RYN_339]|nr:rsgA [Cyanobacteria bacterium RYN_339]